MAEIDTTNWKARYHEVANRAKVFEARTKELERIITANKTPCPEHGVTPSVCSECVEAWVQEKKY